MGEWRYRSTDSWSGGTDPLTPTTTIYGDECVASHSVERAPLSMFGPRNGTASVGNGTTVISAVCGLLTILAELPWFVAWLMVFTIVPANGLFCAIFV
jgi:hypothetical protein